MTKKKPEMKVSRLVRKHPASEDNQKEENDDDDVLLVISLSTQTKDRSKVSNIGADTGGHDVTGRGDRSSRSLFPQ